MEILLRWSTNLTFSAIVCLPGELNKKEKGQLLTTKDISFPLLISSRISCFCLVQVLLNPGVGGGSLEAPLLILTLHTLQCTAQFFFSHNAVEGEMKHRMVRVTKPFLAPLSTFQQVRGRCGNNIQCPTSPP